MSEHIDTDRDNSGRIVTHPLGHCTNCGEALTWVPCTNCNHPNTDTEGVDE